MDWIMTLLPFFLGFSLVTCSEFPVRHYVYVDVLMNWDDAQRYCREKHSDLAAVESMEDIKTLKRPQLVDTWAWIGLRDDPKSWKETMGNDVNSWRWSATGETSKTGYHNWYSGEPNYEHGKEECVMMDSEGLWHDKNCKLLNRFVCYTETNQTQKTYVFADHAQTWSDAQTYCRTHHTDLAAIENSNQNSQVHSQVPSTKPADAEIWFGLYRVPWTWSDQTRSSFRNWKTDSPNNAGGSQHCMAENTEDHVWDDGICEKKYPFLCHQVSKLKTTVRMMIRTDADIAEPSANDQILQQLGSVLQSHGWTDFTLQWTVQPQKQRTDTVTYSDTVTV